MTTKQKQNPQNERYVDQLFQVAEQLSANFSLFPEYEDNAVDHRVKGLVSPQACDNRLEQLTSLDIDSYIEQVVTPSENSARTSAKEVRSEEHTSELQSRPHLVCRLLLEKK